MSRLFSKFSYRFYFICLFLGFGGLIALLTSLINYNLDIQNMQTVLSEQANQELMRKWKETNSFLTGLQRTVLSIRDSAALKNFIQQPNEKNQIIVNQLFYAISNTDASLMQVRYLDREGMEKVRIDWDIGKPSPEVIKDADLQDKSQRYYFVEAAQIPANNFWYSRLDLNMEHKKIEVPHKPVLRIASPVYVNQQFTGIVLVNVHAKEFLENFKASSLFNIALVDHDGYYLIHHDDSRSWSRYLQTGHNVHDDYPVLAMRILRGTPASMMRYVDPLYVVSLGDLFVHDQAHLLFLPNEHVLQGMKDERRQAMSIIVGTILLLSIPLSIVISRIPTKLNEKISRQNKELQGYVGLIDRNIITASTDCEGSIIEVSTAFSRLSGYSKKELLGQEPNILNHPDRPAEARKVIMQTILAEKVWKGEFYNQKKGGGSYWLEATIIPKLDELMEIEGYTAIYQDISDKKRIEELSNTDGLTSLYNRRFFDETIQKELRRAMRDDKQLAFVMLDIDFFKQYNDHYGHQKGDDVLISVGLLLQQVLSRSSDYCFRLGGEEFGLLFSELSPKQALEFAEKIRKGLESLGIEHQWGCESKVITASFGLLCITPAPGITVDRVYQQADQALYAAKNGGRNCVSCDLL